MNADRRRVDATVHHQFGNDGGRLGMVCNAVRGLDQFEDKFPCQRRVLVKQQQPFPRFRLSAGQGKVVGRRQPSVGRIMDIMSREICSLETGLCACGELSYRISENRLANSGFAFNISINEETDWLWESSQLYRTTTASIDLGEWEAGLASHQRGSCRFDGS